MIPLDEFTLLAKFNWYKCVCEAEDRFSRWSLKPVVSDCFDDQELFLAQEIEVGMTAGARIDDGGKVSREIVGVTADVSKRECKGNLQRKLGRPNKFAVSPWLTLN